MPAKSMAESVEPGLKPYQPNQSSRPPHTAMPKKSIAAWMPAGLVKKGSASMANAGGVVPRVEIPKSARKIAIPTASRTSSRPR